VRSSQSTSIDFRSSTVTFLHAPPSYSGVDLQSSILKIVRFMDPLITVSI